MALEAWALDGIQLTSGSFVMMSLTADPPKAKPEWITGADSEWAALVGEPLHDNREFTMRLRVPAAANMDAALDLVASIRDKLRKAARATDGIPLIWTPHNSARSRTFDVLHGEITELPIDKEGEGGQWFKALPIFSMVLTAKPYWYETSETLSSTASASAPLVTLAVTVGGDVPALSRLIVTDSATQARRDVRWGLENRSYNAATSLILDSDALTLPAAGAVSATRTGAYDPNATGNNVIRATAITGMVTALALTGAQSHVGTYRVWARGHFQNAGIAMRLVWRGSGGTWTVNDWVQSSLNYYELDRFAEIDLGTITIPAVRTGTQRWEGRVEVTFPANNPAGTFGDIDLDYLMLVPVGEGSGRSRTIYRHVPGTLLGWDYFTTTVGSVLNGRISPSAHTWSTAAQGVAPQDFTSDGVRMYRNLGTDDWGGGGFRRALFGATNYTDVEVAVQHATDATGTNVSSDLYVITRYVDTNNFAFIQLRRLGPSSVPAYLYSSMRLGGVVTQFDTAQSLMLPTTVMVRSVTYANGSLFGQVYDPSTGYVYAQVDGYSSSLATGGALATGRVGFGEGGPVNAWGRYVDNFSVSTPAAEDVIINSTRTFEYRHDGEMGADSTNTYVGPHGSYRGATFALPAGTTRIAAAARRVDVTNNAVDNVTDATQIQVAYRARGLVVPRA